MKASMVVKQARGNMAVFPVSLSVGKTAGNENWEEERKMVYILNKPILTNYGTYRFSKIGIAEAIDVLADGFVSAVGHKGTAEILSAVLGMPIPVNRIIVKMAPGDIAVVFRVLSLLSDNHLKVLTAEELKAIPFEIGLLERIRI